MGNLYLLLSVAFNVVGQYKLKAGVNKLGALSFNFTDLFKAFTAPMVLGGLVFYFISSVFWIIALSQKDLSFAYPMLSIGYIAIIFISWQFLGESINLFKIAGVFLICSGIILIFKSS